MEQVELKKRSDPQTQKIGPVNGLLFYGFSSGVEGTVAWSNWHLNSLLFSFKFLTRKPFVIHSIGTPHINGTACLVAMVTEESMDLLWWPLVNGLWTIPGGDICVGELSYNQLLRTEKMRKYGGHLVANKVRMDNASGDIHRRHPSMELIPGQMESQNAFYQKSSHNVVIGLWNIGLFSNYFFVLRIEDIAITCSTKKLYSLRMQ